MLVIRQEVAGDVPAREMLLDRCFGPQRRMKTSERLREGRLPASGLAFAAERAGCLVGTVRLWNVVAGEAGEALLLGPIAIDPSLQGEGLGSGLMRTALGRARELGHRAVLLVGDAPYYARFGFESGLTRGLRMPGPVERERFLGLELRPGALDGACGIITATGAEAQVEDISLAGYAAAA